MIGEQEEGTIANTKGGDLGIESVEGTRLRFSYRQANLAKGQCELAHLEE